MTGLKEKTSQFERADRVMVHGIPGVIPSLPERTYSQGFSVVWDSQAELDPVSKYMMKVIRRYARPSGRTARNG